MLLPRRPTAEERRRLTAFVFGLLVGALFMLLEVGGELNRLTLERARLITENAHLAERLAKAEDENGAWDRRVRVKDVDIRLEPLESARVEQALRRHLLADARFLIGKSIADVADAGDVLFRAFDRRAVDVDGRTYVVRLKGLIVAPTLVLYVAVEQKEGP
ncbi:hypothetical protein AB1399_05385 [Hydrogenibacillus schlegelii]|uniref:Sporulation membrane protein YtrI C-terminal domain-containing protein n=1 Tax=Hydrogenibacillus schlegelii TaxID=1484 RepID=A0A2T5GCH1_HYDSH|nr:hypothetical protein [Hydrogenibacillus schlegelii]PTQ53876.1 MAG: hypothetical protein HSCHL_1250 [Hydrogenibacillus schlegelii]